MKYILIIGLLLSCSKPTLTASDELLITSEKMLCEIHDLQDSRTPNRFTSLSSLRYN